ncbi:MAG: hypothetical protein HeimC3_17230 [Candidatus Heimdallarchaeota archaeon LC_3]|nr:MAG: hypothetical protein HeimC3_17230 [Candidatus Heimdallarchaeota archaeon LC_3]
MKVEIKENKVIIEIEIDPKQSASGKMTLIASTGGFKDAGTLYEGKSLRMNLMIGYNNK